MAKITIPTTPADRLHATGLDTEDSDLASTVGWPQITDQMTSMYQALPASERATTVIVSSDYGVDGALQIFGNPQLLPASFSPQLSDWYWLPPHLAATDALMVGYAPSDVAWMCTATKVVGHLVVPYNVVNLELVHSGDVLRAERATAGVVGTAQGLFVGVAALPPVQARRRLSLRRPTPP